MTHLRNNRILLVDDNPAIHEDFRKILLGSLARNAALDDVESILFDEPQTAAPIAPDFGLESAFQGREALDKVAQSLEEGRPYAMAFVDVRMPPGWDGIETIARLWEIDPALQIVVCTAYSDYSWEKMSAKLGVNDSLVILKKPFDNIEVLQLAHALTNKWLVTRQASLRMDELDRMVAERTAALQSSNNEVRRSEERFAKAFRSSPIPLAIQTFPDDRFVDANDAFLRMTGFAREEMIGRTPMELHLCIDYESRIRSLLREDKPIRDLEAQISSRDGKLHTTLVSMERLTLCDEPHVLTMVQDISERLTLEDQLRQAQKMEAIGQLAAGVAHDFNNMLTIIQGHASLQLGASGLSEDTTESLRQITIASQRAADLTSQLLVFSRRQMIRPRVLHIEELLGDLTGMLRRLIGEHIELRCDSGLGLPPIWADQTSIEQVLMNLTLNARDAMPRGGRITISTGVTHITAAQAELQSDVRAGLYVHLVVTDTGTGMDAATRARIFEPFFTTKDVSKGTGMGLATVYGIVCQHEGFIEVKTAPGRGATFRVFFPVTERAAEPVEVPRYTSDPDVHEHTVLVVEDDEAVRAMVKDVLEHHSYRVIEAENADAALVVWRERQGEIELLLTDMVMPGKANGFELSQMLLAERPDLKVIYTSGYSADLFRSDVHLEDGLNYLPKPYLTGKLTAILRRAFEPEPAGV